MDIGSAVISAGANLLSGGMASSAQSKANERNMAFARENLAWQQIYSKRKHEFQVEDLKRAGLNPMLATGMNPSGTGTAGSAGQVAEDGMAKGIQGAVGSAMEAKRLSKELQIAGQQVENLKSQNEKTKAETKSIKDQNKAIEQDAKFYEDNPWYRKANRIMQLIGLGSSSAASAAAGYSFGKNRNKTTKRKKHKFTDYPMRRSYKNIKSGKYLDSARKKGLY